MTMIRKGSPSLAAFFIFRSQMDGISTSVESTPVSGGAESAAPGAPPAASSGGVVETPAAAPAVTPEAPQPVPAQPQPSIGVETVDAASGIEFPDETAFQQLPEDQRVTGWKNARARIDELNSQVKQYSELGDIEQLKTDAELTRSLFSHRQDENGQVVRDERGLPVMTAAPFLTQLKEKSPDAFYTMAWEALDTPIDQNGQTVGDWLLQDKYGLNPQLLDTYKQIQSPSEAARYTPHAVDPAELTDIPAPLHEAYKSFAPEDRDDLQDLFVRDEQRFLARLSERKEHLENQKFITEQRQREEQAQKAEQQRWESEIKQKTLSRGNQKWDQAVATQKERLQTQYQPFGPENSEGNEMVYADIVAHAEKAIQTPQFQQKIEAAWNGYYEYEYYSATGNQLQAARSLAAADKLTLELQREFAKAATLRVETWNKHLKGRIAAPAPAPTRQPAPNNPAQPANPANNGQPQYRTPGKFGLTPARITEIAASVAMRKAGIENRPPGG